jgi:hypothetical protein
MIDNGTEEIHLKKIFENLMFFFFRRLSKIFVLLFLWIALAYTFHYIQRKTYNIHYYISSDYISGQKIDLILSDIRHMLDQKKYSLLSDLIRMPVDDLKKINSFKIIIEEPEYMLSSNVSPTPGFYFNETNTQIKITLKDSLDVNRLVDGLNNFVAGSNYFKKIKKSEEIVLERVNKTLEDQKIVLDSINQINLKKFISPNGSVIFANDLSEIKRNMYSIEERLINNNRELVRIESPVNLINYPVLKKYSFQESVGMAILKSFLVLSGLLIFGYCMKGIRKAYIRFRATQ